MELTQSSNITKNNGRLRLLAATGLKINNASRDFPSMPSLPKAHFPLIDNLADEVRALEEDLRWLADNDCDFDIECQSCPGVIGLDFESLLRILMALIGISVQEMSYQPKKAVRHRMRLAVGRSGTKFLATPCQKDAARRDNVTLTFRDNGPGIPLSDLSTIFDANRGLHHPRQRYAKLSLVRDLVARGQGEVRVVSRLGLGTRFDIEFPVLS